MNKKQLAKMKRDSKRERKQLKRRVARSRNSNPATFKALMLVKFRCFVLSILDKRIQLCDSVSCPVFMVL